MFLTTISMNLHFEPCFGLHQLLGKISVSATFLTLFSITFVGLSAIFFFFFKNIFCCKTFPRGWWVERLWLNHSANVKTVELKQARIGWKAQGHQHYEGDFHTAKSKIDWILSMLQTLTTRLVQSFSAPLHLIWTRGQWSHTLPGQ